MSKFKKVAYISNIDISLSKGPSVNEIEFLDALVNSDIEDVSFYLPQVKNVARESIAQKTTWLTAKPFSSRSLVSRMHCEYQMYKRLKELSKDSSVIVFTRISVLPLALYLLAPKLAGQFHVKTIGDAEFRYLKKVRYFGTLLQKLHQHFYRRILRFAHSVDVVTDKHKEQLEANLNIEGKCKIVSNKVNTSIFFPRDKMAGRQKLGIDQYDFIIGYVGNDPMNRGASELIEVVNTLRRDLSINVGGVVVGGIDKEQMPDVDLQHVKLLGQVDYADVPELIALFDIGVSFLPKWHRGACEQKVRQYIASGVVPVVTPGGSSFVATEGGGKVVENDDIFALSKEIGDLLDKATLAQLSQKCVELAKSKLSHLLLAKERLAFFNEH